MRLVHHGGEYITCLGDEAQDWIAYPPGLESIGRKEAQARSKLKALDIGCRSTMAYNDGINVQFGLEGYPTNGGCTCRPGSAMFRA